MRQCRSHPLPCLRIQKRSVGVPGGVGVGGSGPDRPGAVTVGAVVKGRPGDRQTDLAGVGPRARADNPIAPDLENGAESRDGRGQARTGLDIQPSAEDLGAGETYVMQTTGLELLDQELASYRQELDACTQACLEADHALHERQGRVDGRLEDLRAREAYLRAREATLLNRERTLDSRGTAIHPMETPLADRGCPLERSVRTQMVRPDETCRREAATAAGPQGWDDRVAHLSPERARCETLYQQLVRQRADMESRAAICEGRERQLASAEEEVGRRLQGVLAKQRELDDHLASAARQQETLDARKGELDKLAAQVAGDVETAAAKRHAIDEREKTLAAREAELGDRQSAAERLREEARRQLGGEIEGCASLRNELDERAAALAAEQAAFVREREQIAMSLGERDAQLTAERRAVQEQARQLRDKIEQLKPIWDQVKRQQGELKALRSEMDRRQEALDRREAELDRSARERAGADRSRRHSATEAGELAALVEKLRVREQEPAAREVSHREHAGALGWLTDALEHRQGQPNGFEPPLRKREVGQTASSQEGNPPPARSGVSATTAGNNVAAPPTRPSAAADHNRPAMRSAMEILRTLGARGTDEEILAKLARNPVR